MEETVTLIESYLLRIRNGEDIDEVKLEYLNRFCDVPCEAIEAAAKELLALGYQEKEIKRLLCHNHDHDEHCCCEECCGEECHCGDHDHCGCGCHHDEEEEEHRFFSLYRQELDRYINAEIRLKSALIASIEEEAKSAYENLKGIIIFLEKKQHLIYPHFYEFGVSCFAYEEADHQIFFALRKNDQKALIKALDEDYPLEEKLLGQLASFLTKEELDNLAKDW